MIATKFPRLWHTMKVGDTRRIETLTTYQVQSQVGKVRKRYQRCAEWRWATRTLADGSLLVERVK